MILSAKESILRENYACWIHLQKPVIHQKLVKLSIIVSCAKRIMKKTADNVSRSYNKNTFEGVKVEEHELSAVNNHEPRFITINSQVLDASGADKYKRIGDFLLVLPLKTVF